MEIFAKLLERTRVLVLTKSVDMSVALEIHIHSTPTAHHAFVSIFWSSECT